MKYVCGLQRYVNVQLLLLLIITCLGSDVFFLNFDFLQMYLFIYFHYFIRQVSFFLCKCLWFVEVTCVILTLVSYM